MIHRKKNRPALQRHDILTVSLGSSFFREFVQVFFHPVLSGSVLLSSPCNCVLLKSILFRAFAQVFVYPAILLSIVALNMTLVLNMTAFCYEHFF